MKYKIPVIVFLLTAFYLHGFTQNPIAEYYGSTKGYPNWTDEIHWDNQINMAEYTNGENDFEKFENARDELFNQGGGVLYYPSGTYDFSDAPVEEPRGRGLMLRSNVVILGDAPTFASDATEGEMLLKTKFKFKFLNKGDGEIPAPWNIVGVLPSEEEDIQDISNIGIAWIHLQGATVYFGPQMSWGETYATAGAWYSKKASTGRWSNRKPDGTHPIDPFAGIGADKQYLGAGKNKFVFGCVLEDAVVSNDNIVDYTEKGDFDYYMYKFGSRIGVYGENIFIANNLLPKSTKSFAYSHTTGITKSNQCNQSFGEHQRTIIFDYGKTFGIDVNKGYLNVCRNKNNGYFERGVVIRDNYVYNHGSKGFEISGEWMTVINNHNERDYLKEGDDVYGLGVGWELTLDGFYESVQGGNGCLSDNLSRAFDVGGKAVWLDNNSWNNLGSDPGNDGESILCQRHGGTEIHSWAVTHNEHKYSYNYNNKGYLSGYDVHNQGMLVAWNNTQGTVGNLKGGRLYDCAFIPGNLIEKVNINYDPDVNDCITECPEENPQPPENVKAIRYSISNDYIQISWRDASDKEIGYRIDRRISGSDTWTTTAYRPRKSKGHENNEQKWFDYLAPTKYEYEYRVVALNCDDNEVGASEPVGVELVDKTENPQFYPEPGTFETGGVRVEIHSNTPDTKVYYTTDGTEPTQESNLYSEAIELWFTANFKARAFHNELGVSDINQAGYEILGTENYAPAFHFVNNAENNPRILEMTSDYPYATIYYTTDGTAPDLSSEVFTNAIRIREPMTIKAVTAFNDNTLSDVSELVMEQAEDPQMSDCDAEFTDDEPLRITISCATQNADVRFTLDGTEPTLTSQQYTNPITINEDGTVLKAKAFLENGLPGEVSTCEYIISGLAQLEKNNGIRIYPNPLKETFHLEMRNKISGEISIVLSDTFGKILYEKHIIKNSSSIKKEFDVSNFQSGMYFITINTNAGNIVKTFVKQ